MNPVSIFFFFWGGGGGGKEFGIVGMQINELFSIDFGVCDHVRKLTIKLMLKDNASHPY